MTHLAFLADIHGNLPALEAVLNDLSGCAIDQFIVPGDVTTWAPFSAGVVERVVQEGWPVMRGNHEFYLLDYGTPRAPAHWQGENYSLLPWAHQQLKGHWQNVIAGWPDTLSLRFPDAPPLRVIHGTPHSAWQPILPTASDEEIEVLLQDVEEDWLVAAHTHLPMDRRVGRWRIFNPGSVGVPLDGNRAASTMILDGDENGWRASFRRVPYDLVPLFAEFRRQRFLEMCGLTGHLVWREFETARCQVAPFLRWREAHCPDAPFSLQLLDEFDKIDLRDYTPPAYQLDG